MSFQRLIILFRLISHQLIIKSVKIVFIRVIKGMTEILKNIIFPAILSRIQERKDALVNMIKFKSAGLEGWFRVEIITALANTQHAVKEIHNSGPDLLLESGIKIELKGGTDFNINFIKEGVKYGAPCLFIANGSNKNAIRKLERDKDVKVVRHETFSDGKNKWIIGLIIPRINTEY